MPIDVVHVDPSVVFLNDYCYVQGGASRVAIDEAIALASCGVDVTFVGAVGPVCEELAVSPVVVINLNQTELSNFRENRSVAFQSFWNKRAYHAVKSLLTGFDKRTSVVHLHGYTKALSCSPVRYAVANDFKVVCTLHDFFCGMSQWGLLQLR